MNPLNSFKTKGNLTKHMKSKAHYKKCEELGLTPLPLSVDDDGADDDTEGASMTSGDHTSTVPGDSDTDDLTDGEEGENDSSGKLIVISIFIREILTLLHFVDVSIRKRTASHKHERPFSVYKRRWKNSFSHWSKVYIVRDINFVRPLAFCNRVHSIGTILMSSAQYYTKGLCPSKDPWNIARTFLKQFLN